MERHEVRAADGRTIGWVAYETASDLWCEAVFATREGVVRGEWRSCEAPPDVDGREPHTLQTVRVSDRGEDHGAFLFCPTCAALVTPPFDGYAYLDYPESWMALAEATP
jgi:hypothetical protein